MHWIMRESGWRRRNNWCVKFYHKALWALVLSILELCIPWHRCTVIYSGHIIPGYFSELSSMKHTAQFKNCTTARMHWHMNGLQWHFEVIFPSQDTIRSFILFTMYYFTSFYCNEYLFIPTLHGNLKFHNHSIHTIPNTAGSESFTESHPEPPPGATQFWEKTNSQQTLTYDNFLLLIR